MQTHIMAATRANRRWAPGPQVERALDDPHRPPMPPGCAVTWDAITAGTALEGTEYPVVRHPLAVE